MKVKELIQQLQELDPEMDILFPKSSWTSEMSVNAELVNGYSVSHRKKDNVCGTRPPIFVDHEMAHRVCEDGKTYLDFASRRVRPALYLHSKEPNDRSFYNRYMKNKTKEQGVEQTPLFSA